jgi:hypothetical protein
MGGFGEARGLLHIVRCIAGFSESLRCCEIRKMSKTLSDYRTGKVEETAQKERDATSEPTKDAHAALAIEKQATPEATYSFKSENCRRKIRIASKSFIEGES